MSSSLALKLGYINKTHTHIHRVEPKTLYFDFITKSFSRIYLEEKKKTIKVSQFHAPLVS